MRTHKNNKNKKKYKYKYKKYGGADKTKNINKYASLDNFQAKKIRCSPKVLNELNMFSCYTDKTLFKLRDLWNAKYPNAFISSTDGKEIHKLLSKYMRKVCKTESCWLDQGFINQKDINVIETESFAPEQPDDWEKKPNEWLTSSDILKVMEQYEKAYKCFEFIGPTPIDFDKKLTLGECVWDELCNFSVDNQIKNGKFKIGIVFNTDPHNKSGQHWISMFINIKKGEIFFFDSVGDTAPPEIKKFVERVKEQGKKLGIEFEYDENHPVEHQYGNTECGIYSLFFIVHMLQDKITEDYLKTHIIKDKHMSEFRNKYFNKSNSHKKNNKNNKTKTKKYKK